MFGADILVSPKLTQKFILPNESVQMIFDDKVVMEITNESETPRYEVQLFIPGLYYEWTSKKIRGPGQYQLFYSD